ncbi:MAG: hypothetical protein WC005_00870 [Candidatus Nanopelagicales bacterium]
MRMTMTHKALLPIGAIALAVLLSGCGGSSDENETQAAPAAGTVTSSQAPDSTQGQQDQSAQQDQLRTCMSKQGITLPSRASGDAAQPPAGTTAAPGNGPNPGQGQPGQLPDGVDQQQFQKAMQACGGFTGGFGGPAGATGRNSVEFKAYESCLADHGVKTSTNSARPSFNSADPTVASAMRTCAPLRPKLGAQPSSSPTS